MYNLSRRSFLRSSIVITTGLSLGLTGCMGSDETETKARFAVLSDPHVYDSALGTSGSAFTEYLASDRKMLAESTEILEAMAEELLAVENLDFVLVPGDLTKDGEYVCHEKFVSIMDTLRSNGIDVYVVPGNHDINNPHAVSFSGDTTTDVETITPEGFAELYAQYGYGNAIYRDTNSLSYIAKVSDKIWLFAIDSCKYEDNDTSPETSGAISEETLLWLEEKIAAALAEEVLPIAMLHHGMTPHFAAQTQFFPEYIIDDYASVGERLADAGLNIFFTGHFHAQDIIKAEFTSSELYEVETGSTVTAPCPYRVIDIDVPTATMEISSYEINSIPSNENFATYKNEFIATGMQSLYTAMLPMFGIDSAIAPAAAEIHVMHYNGDENYSSLSASSNAIIQSLINSGNTDAVTLGYALTDWATEKEPPDNDTTISL